MSFIQWTILFLHFLNRLSYQFFKLLLLLLLLTFLKTVLLVNRLILNWDFLTAIHLFTFLRLSVVVDRSRYIIILLNSLRWVVVDSVSHFLQIFTNLDILRIFLKTLARWILLNHLKHIFDFLLVLFLSLDQNLIMLFQLSSSCPFLVQLPNVLLQIVLQPPYFFFFLFYFPVQLMGLGLGVSYCI